jgi:hypothetical protein
MNNRTRHVRQKRPVAGFLIAGALVGMLFGIAYLKGKVK